MKKASFILIILIIALLNGGFESKYSEESKKIIHSKEMALSIAEIVLVGQYGKGVRKHKPFQVYDMNQYWVVKGKDSKGGPYIEIEKSDCRIRKVQNGK